MTVDIHFAPGQLAFGHFAPGKYVLQLNLGAKTGNYSAKWAKLAGAKRGQFRAKLEKIVLGARCPGAKWMYVKPGDWYRLMPYVWLQLYTGRLILVSFIKSSKMMWHTVKDR